jgi:hypothetical protein
MPYKIWDTFGAGDFFPIPAVFVCKCYWQNCKKLFYVFIITQIFALFHHWKYAKKVGNQDTFGWSGNLVGLPGLFVFYFVDLHDLQHFLKLLKSLYPITCRRWQGAPRWERTNICHEKFKKWYMVSARDVSKKMYAFEFLWLQYRKCV